MEGVELLKCFVVQEEKDSRNKLDKYSREGSQISSVDHGAANHPWTCRNNAEHAASHLNRKSLQADLAIVSLANNIDEVCGRELGFLHGKCSRRMDLTFSDRQTCSNAEVAGIVN